MQVADLLASAGSSGAIDALAKKFGLSRDETLAVVAGVVPEVTRRLERNTLSRGGLADLVAMLGQAGAGAPDLDSGAAVAQGNALLEQVFGTRDASRAVAARASYASGIGESVIKAMLPYIIQMVMSAFAKRASGGLGDILSKIPDIGTTAPSSGGQRGGAAFPIPGGRGFPGGMSAPGGGSPLPGPEGMQIPGSSPYGDLSDVIRRGGSGARVDGSPLWRIVRNILGGALGFQSRGIVSWIVRMVIMRYGWSILRAVLGRMFMRR